MRCFVYGSLLSGLHNHHILAGATLIGERRTEPRYDMISMGSFPAVIDGGSTSVVGELYEIDAYTLERLDRLEGNGSFYQRHERRLDCGEIAWIYELITPSLYASGGCPKVLGCWRTHYQNREARKKWGITL